MVHQPKNYINQFSNYNITILEHISAPFQKTNEYALFCRFWHLRLFLLEYNIRITSHVVSVHHMQVSWNGGVPLVIIHSNRIVPYKPASYWGYPHEKILRFPYENPYWWWCFIPMTPIWFPTLPASCFLPAPGVPGAASFRRPRRACGTPGAGAGTSWVWYMFFRKQKWDINPKTN